MKTILIQGAMESETELLISKFSYKERIINGYRFFEAILNDKKIVISITKMGIMNATIATMIGINKFKPDIVINQGTAGGHTAQMQVGDIIIGESAIYLNNPRTPVKGLGEGSNALEWIPGKQGTFLLNADPNLIEKAKNIHYEGNLIIGRLGSGDIYSREADRINLLHNQMGELSEDMETVAVYKVCEIFNIPVIGIRVISNNEITGNSDIESQFVYAQTTLQKYIYDFAESL